MPAIRKLPLDITFDDAEDEVFFSRAALKADPDALDLLDMTDDWLAIVQSARDKDRAARIAETDASAARVITNHHLDGGCTAFGDDLFLAVEKNRQSPRWTQFFSVPVSRFVKTRFDKQVQTVKGWLGPNVNDAVLDKHRHALNTWSTAGSNALDQTRSAAMVRGSARIGREEMAEDLTRERDGLFDALSARARENGLPRDWPNQFFRVESRKSTTESSDEAAPATTET